MKIAVVYFSKTGKTAEMAREIAAGAESAGAKAALFPLETVTPADIESCEAVVFGTPTYLANACWQMGKWFDEAHAFKLGGKLGAAYATADYAQGGADTAIQNLIGHMLVKGMVVYSGGAACGQPYIHLGAVALKENFEQSRAMFRVFGERIARKAFELFSAGEDVSC